MTDKEKAAEMYRHKTPEHELTVTGTFLAGCAYQEQVDREVIEAAYENATGQGTEKE